MNRQDFDSDALFGPHNEHMVLVPVLIFKALWAATGLGGYWAFRLLVVLLHLACVVLVYAVARRRLGPWLALAPALVLLFLGTAWEIVLWPFEIQFLIPAAAGLGVLLLLEREDLRGDLIACGLLVLVVREREPRGPGGARRRGGDPVPARARRPAAAGGRPPGCALPRSGSRSTTPTGTSTEASARSPSSRRSSSRPCIAGIAGFRYGTVRTPALIARARLHRGAGRAAGPAPRGPPAARGADGDGARLLGGARALPALGPRSAAEPLPVRGSDVRAPDRGGAGP